MTVELSVNRVRQEIIRLTGGGISRFCATEPILEMIFAESFAQLLGPDKTLNWMAVGKGEIKSRQEWNTALQEHLYHRLIGPKLHEQVESLQHHTDQVVAFWEAAKTMCRWIIGFLWQNSEGERGRLDPDALITVLFDPGKGLSVKFKQKNWTDSVLLTDIRHLVLKTPGKYYSCVANLKLGDENKAVDYVLACLYSRILLSRDPKASAAIALIDFKPDLEERFFPASDLSEPLRSLKALVGRVAGVIPM